jgi:hypothetical protein
MSGTGGGPPLGGSSPPGAGPELSHQEAAEYIASMLEGLTQVATSAQMPFLAYLISVALEEAKIQKIPRP